MIKQISASVSVFLALGLAPWQSEGQPVSAVDLHKSDAAGSFTLSPDGDYIAFIAENTYRSRALFTQNLDTRETQSWMGGGYGPQVVDYCWANPTRLVYQSTNTDGYGGLFSVERDSAKITKLTKGRNQLYLVDPLIGRESLLVARKLGDDSPRGFGASSYYRFFSENDASGSARLSEVEARKGKTLAKSDLYLLQPNAVHRDNALFPTLFVDSAGKVQIYLAGQDQARWHLAPQEGETESTIIGDLTDFRVLGLDPSGRMALVAGYFGQDRAGIYRYDLAGKSLGTMIYSDPDWDLMDTARLVTDNVGRPVGLRYTTDRSRTIWFSNEMQQIQGVIDQQLPERANTVIALDPPRGRFLIESLSDRQPTEIKYLDLEKRSLTTVYASKPEIDPEVMAPTESLKMTAANGRELRGFLTRPRGMEAPYPTVVLLARTPRQPTTWEFDPAAQYLAGRGYAVLRVRTRGAPGYGDHFSNVLLGDIEGMMSDIADSIAWTVREGLVDPKRVGVAGSYFSASVALRLASAYPELVRCVFALDGFLDLNAYQQGQMARLTADDSAFSAGLRAFHKGDLKSQLEAYSPFAHIDSIRCPVLIVYPSLPSSSFGSNRDARKMIDALERTGVSVEGFDSPIVYGFWSEPVDEDDLARNEEDFEALFTRIETFLDKHL